MKRIPKTFQLFNHTLVVRIVSKRDWDELAEKYDDMEDRLGFFLVDDNVIVLLRQKYSVMLHTFCHELMHAVLYYADSPVWSNEHHVDMAGGLLAQALMTAR